MNMSPFIGLILLDIIITKVKIGLKWEPDYFRLTHEIAAMANAWVRPCDSTE